MCVLRWRTPRAAGSRVCGARYTVTAWLVPPTRTLCSLARTRSPLHVSRRPGHVTMGNIPYEAPKPYPNDDLVGGVVTVGDHAVMVDKKIAQGAPPCTRPAPRAHMCHGLLAVPRVNTCVLVCTVTRRRHTLRPWPSIATLSHAFPSSCRGRAARRWVWIRVPGARHDDAQDDGAQENGGRGTCLLPQMSPRPVC